MKNLIRKILREDIIEYYDDDYSVTRIASWLEPPYFKNMEGLGLTNEEVKKVLSEVFGEKIDFNEYMREKDVFKWSTCSNKPVYEEKINSGEWKKYEYDKNCNKIYEERSDGYRENLEYVEGHLISYLDSNGYWEDYERNKDGEILYWKNSNGDWEKYKYNKDGNTIYEEDNNGTVRKYDKNGCVIFKEFKGTGKWTKYKMDKRFDDCRPIYEERNTGYWRKREYDKRGWEVYSETSTGKIKKG